MGSESKLSQHCFMCNGKKDTDRECMPTRAALIFTIF
uniref:Uncharacterized protein n=1 Tax=Anguilla anguilla TaxID=7936 RepID=A0A0E9PYN3_ANGAN